MKSAPLLRANAILPLVGAGVLLVMLVSLYILGGGTAVSPQEVRHGIPDQFPR